MPPAELHEGYLLKKKRRKVQGYAKRYFRLYENGALAYSVNPNSPIRESTMVTYAYVHASRRTRAITIDSGVSVMHCKALNDEDFETWTKLLQPFSDRGVSGGGPGSVLSKGMYLPSKVNAIDASGGLAAPASPQDAPSSQHQVLQLSDDLLVTADRLGKAISSKNQSASESILSQLKNQISQLQEAASDLGTPFSGYASRSMGNNLAPPGRRRSSVSSRSLGGSQQPASPQGASSSSGRSGNVAAASGGVAAGIATGAGAAGLSQHTNSPDQEVHRFTVDDDDDDDDDAIDDGNSSGEEANNVDSPQVHHDTPAALPVAEILSEEPQVSRRSQLPHPVAGDEFSMLGVLRKNVGKDLSTISFPVTFNEPLSALQRLTEDIEYSSLLDKAAEQSSINDKLLYVAVWATTSCASNKYRSSRKPFNPLLYETYESIRPDKGYVFISEKVSHHPPILAFYAEGLKWSYTGHVAPTQKFWGRSFEVITPGSFLITLQDGTQFTLTKPSSFVRNIISGQKYLEVSGDLVVSHCASNARAVVNYKEGTTFGGAASRNHIVGKVMDQNDQIVYEFTGKWDDAIDLKGSSGQKTRLWTINPYPPNAQQYYGFSTFNIQMNEITDIEKNKMAPTDSRLRPDQRALELGQVDNAESLKKQVEEKQREARKSETPLPDPAWFTKHGDDWHYNGQYFIRRNKQEWSGLQDIFVPANQ